MSRIKDLTGNTYHNLIVVGRASSNRQGNSTWLCKCICGKDVVYSSDHLTRKSCPVKSCGCLKKSLKGENHHQWNGYKEISGDWWYNHVLRERKQSNRAKIPVTVSIEYAYNLYLTQNKECALSGVPLTISSSSLYNTASIDRIDSSKGYEEHNIQWVHKHVNFMKRTYTQEYFIKMCKLVASKSGGACEVV
jgi:hypothetical protein